VVLRLGRNAGVSNVKSVTYEQVVAAITGAEFGTLQPASADLPTNGGSDA
jgi:hypothetical protein